MNKIPFFLISHMRSGSNFLSNVVCKSTSSKFTTIYNSKLITEPEEFLVIKSHAPSYMHLLSECGCFIPSLNAFPHKMIVMMRDPRDMFISLYDWYRARFKTDIDQKTFIYEQRFSYSVNGMGSLVPIDIFREFTKNWWHFNSTAPNIYRIKFEELISDKDKYFDEIFNFLELKEKPDPQSYGEMVKQSESQRQKRGSDNNWKIYYQEYKVLIDLLNDEIEPEIRHLGYEF